LLSVKDEGRCTTEVSRSFHGVLPSRMLYGRRSLFRSVRRIPSWLLCGLIGIAGAVIARVIFVGTGLANTLPYQLAVCAAIGVITALLVWLVGFGH
jgi:hypothetical protein